MFINALAQGSAMECAAVLDVCAVPRITDLKLLTGKSSDNAGGLLWERKFAGRPSSIEHVHVHGIIWSGMFSIGNRLRLIFDSLERN